MIVENTRGRRRRAHPAHFRVRLRVRVNARVGDFDGLFEPVGKALRRHLVVIPGLEEVGVDRVGRHLARQLARRGATHAVGHDEQRAARPDVVLPHVGLQRCRLARQVRDEKAILVVIARAAQIGLAEDLDTDGLVSSEHRYGRRRCCKVSIDVRRSLYRLTPGASRSAVEIHSRAAPTSWTFTI